MLARAWWSYAIRCIVTDLVQKGQSRLSPDALMLRTTQWERGSFGRSVFETFTLLAELRQMKLELIEIKAHASKRADGEEKEQDKTQKSSCTIV